MSSPEYYSETIKLLRKSLESIYKGDASVSDVLRWLNLCVEAIETLEKLVNSEKLTRPIKQKYQTSMTHLLCIKNKLNKHLKAGGSLHSSLIQDKNIQDQSTSKEDLIKWDDMTSAFERRIRSGVITNLGHLDAVSFLNDAQSLFETKIKSALQEYNSLKVNAELAAEYIIEKSDSVSVDVKYFNTENVSIYKITDLVECFTENIKEPILREMEEFEERGSGWSLQEILSLTININKLNPMKGSSYIPLPDEIAKRKACVNVQNNDNECFKWAVLSALHPQMKNANRVLQYKPYEKELDFNGISHPMSLKQVKKFERQNDISINVYMLKMFNNNNYKVEPCYITSLKKERHVNLLLLEEYYVNEDEDEADNDDDYDTPPPKLHYVWIKNLSRLVRKQLTNSKNKCFICDKCLHFFNTSEKLEKHEVDCEQLNKCKIVLPAQKDNVLSFNNFNRVLKVPYVIYADFECLLKPVENDLRTFQQHQAYSIGFYLKCSFDNARSMYRSYRQEKEGDKTPAEWFVDNLKQLAIELEQIHSSPEPMRLTSKEYQQFEEAKTCHICKRFFSAKDKKVRDHCHLTGRFRGAAHEGCNVNFKDARFIPVIFHNLTGYDSHFIVKELATAENFKGRVQLIAENKERYIAFTKYIDGSDINFRFIDSFRFMASSLEKLASYLEKPEITSTVFEKVDGYSADQIKLLLRKGVFPYDYVSSFDKLKENELPTKDNFFSKLYECDITDADYEHAKSVWSILNIKTLGEYSDIYLKTDVLLLADVFENFRSTCMVAYGLDPAHYYTTPGLTWDAMLKYTGVKLELLMDVDMLMFVERGIRGGVSQCSNRYAKANNKYMKNEYNPAEEEKYLMYFDVNNMYGWAMTQYLPKGEFKWIEDINNPNFFNVPDDHDYGYILEVDLEYPENIHDDHKDLPLCPQHMAPPTSKQKKLLTTLYNKDKYIIHYRALKQALKHGLILKKIHRALQFKQSAWLKPYVDLNTEKRKQSKNEFEKLFFKLLINAVYGKTMENERKRVDVKLVNRWKGRYGAETLIARPNFHSRSIFSEDLVAIQLARTEIVIRKPIYVGLCVLDISKTLIYDFHYGYMRKRIGDKCKVLYTDTDSLIYEIKDLNIYEIMKQDIDKFDTSDYPEENEFGMPCKNKKVIGLMKDECNGHIMSEFIGLRSKMYSILIQNEKLIKKAKGVKSRVVKNVITFDDYRECLFNEKIINCEQNNIRSRLHIVRTEKQKKVALSPYDDKRYLVPTCTDTLPWGHWSILDDEQILQVLEEDFNVLEGMEEVEGVTDEVGRGLQKEPERRASHIRSLDELEDGVPEKKRPRV